MDIAPVLAVDFGTSNSAAGVLVQDRPFLIEVEAGENTLPTALFFEQDRDTVYGRAAQAALTQGREGRYMRALKSVLGTPLMHEPRRIMGEKLTLIDAVARFLAQVKARADAVCYQDFRRVLSGRPVRFHHDPARDARAEADLRLAYERAGFDEVTFLFEPEAAARAQGAGGGLGLIVDIGGGTSDFSVVKGGEVLASHGIRLGGTDFDAALSIDHVMPLLGRGTMLRDAFGSGVNEAPQAIFRDLASWQKIAFLYSGDTLRFARGMRQVAVEQDKFERLCAVLEAEIGHDIAFAVERGKIAATRDPNARIDLKVLENGLGVDLGAGRVSQCLAPHVQQLAAGARATLDKAGVVAETVERVVFVGGASLMPDVERVVMPVCPNAEAKKGAAFTAVIDGLCHAAADQTGG